MIKWKLSHTRNTSNEKFAEPYRVTIIFNPYSGASCFWGCFGLYMHDQCCDLGLFWFYASQVICTTRHWPTATSGIVKRMGIHPKNLLTPPSAAKIYVFTPNSLQIGSLKSSWVQCLKLQWLTIEWLPLYERYLINIPYKYTNILNSSGLWHKQIK